MEGWGKAAAGVDGSATSSTFTIATDPVQKKQLVVALHRSAAAGVPADWHPSGQATASVAARNAKTVNKLAASRWRTAPRLCVKLDVVRHHQGFPRFREKNVLANA
jgi:hypothetical protein